MSANEGVILQIVDGVAVFVSSLTEQVVTSKRLADFTTHQDIGDYSMNMSSRSWWPQVRAKFEREAASFLNHI